VKRTVAITFGFSDLSGAAKMGSHFARHFRERKIHVLAFCFNLERSDSGELAQRLSAAGCEVIDCGETISDFKIKIAERVLQHVKRSQAAGIISLHQNDVKYAAYVSWRAKIHYVVSAQNMPNFHGNRFVRTVKNIVYKMIAARRPSLIVATSEVIRRHYHKAYGVDLEKIVVLPNAIETSSQINRTPDRVYVDFEKSDQINIVNVARIDPQKGQLQLLEAFKRLRDEHAKVKLCLVGDINPTAREESKSAGYKYKNKVLSYIKENDLKDHVKLMGWCDDVPQILASNDVYVHASLWEGLPLAVLEAMLSGLPVVTTDCFGTLEHFVENVNGFMVKAGNATSLYHGLSRCLSMKQEQREQMGKANQRVVIEYYGVDKIGSQFARMAETVFWSSDTNCENFTD